MGILIALDGLDGSGKETQTRLLEQALKAQGIPCRNISFPTYDDQMSAAVKLYLSGAFGNDPNAVNGYAASSFVAPDRYCRHGDPRQPLHHRKRGASAFQAARIGVRRLSGLAV